MATFNKEINPPARWLWMVGQILLGWSIAILLWVGIFGIGVIIKLAIQYIF